MTDHAARAAEPDENTIVITREFDAPRDLLYAVWTEPHHVEKWFGPEGFSTRVEKQDLRVGGRSRYVMTGPDGNEYPGEGEYLEIVHGEKIVSTDEFGKEYVADNLPQGMVTTVLFEDLGSRTRLTIHIAHPTAEDRKKHEDMGVVAGWGSTLDCLDVYVAELKEGE